MGKGDKRTKRGKTVMGSYGVSRPKKERNIRKTQTNKTEQQS